MGQSSPLTLIPLKAVARFHTIAGIAESTSVPYRPFIEWIKRLVDGKEKYCSLRFFARQNRIPYFAQQGASQLELAEFVKSVKPDIICVSGFSRLLQEDVFALPPYGTINFHPALLPHYRGPQPLFWHYYFMETETGATIHYIDAGEDTGDIIRQKSLPILPGIPGEELAKNLIELGAELMVEALRDIENGDVKRIPQKDLPCPFRARQLKKDEQLLQWDWPIDRVWHFLRGIPSKNPILKSKLPGLSWRVTTFERMPLKGAAGEFHLHPFRCYLTHDEGKIYVRPTWSLRNFLRDGAHLFKNRE